MRADTEHEKRTDAMGIQSWTHHLPNMKTAERRPNGVMREKRRNCLYARLEGCDLALVMDSHI